MKPSLLLLAILVAQWSCKKPDFNDLAGNSTLSAVVLLHDTYSGNPGYIPIKNLTVYLRNSTNTNQYLYSVKTDNLGQFSFNGLDSTLTYQADALFDTLQARYSGKITYDFQHLYMLHQRDTLLLDIDTSLQNGIHITVTDYLGGAVPNATVWVFNSPAYFFADTIANMTFSITTDGNGIANRYALQPNYYYFRTKTRGGGIELLDERKLMVGVTGITNVPIVVNPVPVGLGNGIEIKTINSGGGSEPNTRLFFYKNYDTYIADSNKFNASNFQLVSALDGRATAYIINPGTYYIWARKFATQHDTLTSRIYKNIVVGNAIVKDSITIK